MPLDVIILRHHESFVHLAFILFDLVEAEFVVESATIILTGLQGTLLLVLIKLGPLNLCQHLTYHSSFGRQLLGYGAEEVGPVFQYHLLRSQLIALLRMLILQKV